MQGGIFLSRIMTFTYDEEQRALTFESASPDGVSRQQLIALVPEWAQEQLFDPVPGTLRLQFRNSAELQAAAPRLLFSPPAPFFPDPLAG